MRKSGATGQIQYTIGNVLSDGLAVMALSFDERQKKQAIDFIALLAKWNKHFNLTAIREPLAMVSGHLLDSLSVLPYLEGETVLDIGSGAGLPGIPLAIGQPQKKFTLLDSNGKKTRFMLQAVSELGLTNIEVVKARIEEYRPVQGFDTVISRALGDLAQMCEYAMHCCHPSSQILAMKGRQPDEELAGLPQAVEMSWVRRLRVPGLEDVDRHLLCLRLKQV